MSNNEESLSSAVAFGTVSVAVAAATITCSNGDGIDGISAFSCQMMPEVDAAQNETVLFDPMGQMMKEIIKGSMMHFLPASVGNSLRFTYMNSQEEQAERRHVLPYAKTFAEEEFYFAKVLQSVTGQPMDEAAEIQAKAKRKESESAWASFERRFMPVRPKAATSEALATSSKIEETTSTKQADKPEAGADVTAKSSAGPISASVPTIKMDVTTSTAPVEKPKSVSDVYPPAEAKSSETATLGKQKAESQSSSANVGISSLAANTKNTEAGINPKPISGKPDFVSPAQDSDQQKVSEVTNLKQAAMSEFQVLKNDTKSEILGKVTAASPGFKRTFA